MSDIFPQSLSHHPNGRFLAVVGDGEYVIYTAQVSFFMLLMHLLLLLMHLLLLLLLLLQHIKGLG